MSNRSLVRAFAIAALVVAGAAAIAIGAYNAGVTQGLAHSGALTAPAGGPPYAVYPYMWHRPWGLGLFPVFPFFFLLLFFFAVRGLVWRGRGWRARYGGVPPAFEEWHRRAHAERPTPPTA